MIELSESNFECGYSVYGNAEPLIHITTISKDRSIELMQEILQALDIKKRIEGRIRSMTNADASCNQGLTNEGYAILGVLHDLLKVKS